MWKEVEDFVDRSAKEIIRDIDGEFIAGGLNEEELKEKMKWIYEEPHNAKLVLNRSEKVLAYWDGKIFESWGAFMNSDRKMDKRISRILKEL
jgi:Txe/YoeB family toxin of Txe-Axe toxin-antitoxin module